MAKVYIFAGVMTVILASITYLLILARVGKGLFKKKESK